MSSFDDSICHLSIRIFVEVDWMHKMVNSISVRV